VPAPACKGRRDPNIRTELLTDEGYLQSVETLMAIAAYVLPSDADADLLFPGQPFDGWSARLLAQGAKAVVLKRGDQGCIGRDASGTVTLAAHPVNVVDPTGAGDCFCATFVTLTAAGQALSLALDRANAAGALAVGRLGPMEGNSSLALGREAACPAGVLLIRRLWPSSCAAIGTTVPRS
jgi:sugar/nucleoside kinase (ribokinase family)